MKTSCGILISDGENILAGLATGKKDEYHMYDLAGKGCMDDNELPIDTAIRELREETGLVISRKTKDKIKDLGTFKYVSGKNLHLFSLHVQEMPSTEILFCDSKFIMYEREMPELKGYKIISINDLQWFYKSLENVLSSLVVSDWLADETVQYNGLKLAI